MPLDRIKSLFIVPGTAAGGPSAAVAAGLALAARAGAAVEVMAAAPELNLSHALLGRLAAELVAGENQARRERAAAVAAQARAAAAALAVDCTVATPALAPVDLLAAMARQSRGHDLCLADADAAAYVLEAHPAQSLLFGSGRPLLLVPGDQATLAPVARAVVAWDGSARASRALHDALPLLDGAEVELVGVTGEKDLSGALGGEALLPLLARHGVRARVRLLALAGGSVAGTLLGHVAASSAQLLVMGAFVHSRLRQAVLGGVTRSLLERAPVPTLMSF